MAMSINKILKNLESRIEKLELSVLDKHKRDLKKADSANFKGATGGLRFLATKGFFDKRRTFGEINEALASNGYHYSKQAVQTPLNNLSKPGSLLVSFRDGGRKIYARRK